jgi:hypothetical protein
MYKIHMRVQVSKHSRTHLARPQWSSELEALEALNALGRLARQDLLLI